MILKSQDTSPPDRPVLLNVNVQPITNNVIVEWLPSDSLDTKGYVVYRKNTNWFPLDTVFGRLNITYTDISSNAGLYSEQYRIAAFDSSNNVSLMTALDKYHNTIYLFPYQVKQDCIHKIKLAFNDYKTWDNGVSGYIIYKEVDYSGTFNIIDTTSGNETVYYDADIVDSLSYCYYIEAINSDGRRSMSNRTCKLTSIPGKLSFINADFATISDYNQVSLSFTIDTARQDVNSFKLLSSSNIGGPYKELIDFGKDVGTTITHTESINMNEEINYYKLAAYNECGYSELESNVASNLLLNVSSNELVHSLTWNDYSIWLGGVSHFNIFRLNENNQPELINTVYNTLSSNIDITELSYEELYGQYVVYKTSSNFCYFIEAYESASNPYGIMGSSRSNLACLTEQHKIHFPNAFTPNGNDLNDKFKPMVLYVNTQSYQFTIYNRWGEKIFETKDPAEGWTGKVKGKKVKGGTYVYVVKFITADNQEYIKRGTFALIYP